MYILNFLLKKDVSFYLTMFHTFSILGLSIGFASNAGFLFIKTENKFLEKGNIGPLITILMSFFLLIINEGVVLYLHEHHQ